MPKINQNKEMEKFILKKAFEISYALCRIAKNLKNTYFSNIFEERGLQILDLATTKDFESLKNSFLGIEYFIRLGEELGLFRNHIAELLIGEINSLNKYIIEAEEEILMPELNIEDIFISKNGKTLKKTKQNESFLNSAKYSAKDSAKEKDSAIDSAIDSAMGSAIGSATADNSATRDSAMINNSATENNSATDSAIGDSAMGNYLATGSATDSAKEKDSAKEDSAMINNSAMDNSAMNSATGDSATQKDSAMTDNSEMASYSAIGSATDSAMKDSATTDSAMEIENNSTTEDNPLNIQNNTKQEPTFIHISKIISEEPKQESKDDSIGIIKVRKSVFLDKIRYFEEFRLKDLEKMFPELSERTLRYYLSDLISLGFIEKIGISGPNVLYRFNKNKEADILSFIQKERESVETENQPLEIEA
jgi:DNA-binding HxlR family transcriptional regulator